MRLTKLLSSDQVALIAHNSRIHICQLVPVISNLGTHQSFTDSFRALRVLQVLIAFYGETIDIVVLFQDELQIRLCVTSFRSHLWIDITTGRSNLISLDKLSSVFRWLGSGLHHWWLLTWGMNKGAPLGRENGLIHVGSLRWSYGVNRTCTLGIELSIRFGREVVSSSHWASLKCLAVRALLSLLELAFFSLVIWILHGHLLLWVLLDLVKCLRLASLDQTRFLLLTHLLLGSLIESVQLSGLVSILSKTVQMSALLLGLTLQLI